MKSSVISFFAVIWIIALAPLVAARDVATPPNILFILTDDQGYGDISAHGHPVLKTPHLDALAAESVRFTNFHVAATCSPSRAEILTGLHHFRTGVTHTISPVIASTSARHSFPRSSRMRGMRPR